MTEHVDPTDAAARAAEQAARVAAIRARRGQAPVATTESTTSTPATPVLAGSSALDFAPPTGPAMSAPQTVASTATTTPPQAAASTVSTAPVTPALRPRKVSVAAGGKILVTGLTTSAVFGLTSVISAANRPSFDAQAVAVVEPTTTVLDPALTSLPLDPGATLPVVETIPPLSAPPTFQTIVLELPTLVPVTVPAGTSGGTGGSGGSSAPASSATTTATTTAPSPSATTAPPVTPATPAPTTTAAPTTTTPPPPPTTTAPSK